MARPGTIVVAAVSPERKIPWTKPEDITVGPKFPLQLGKPDGIAAPYSIGKTPTIHRAAPVLFADGKSIALLDTIDPSILYALLTPERRRLYRQMEHDPRGSLRHLPLASVRQASGRLRERSRRSPSRADRGGRPADPTHAQAGAGA